MKTNVSMISPILNALGLMRVSEHEAKAREAFKAGWRTNAVGEETHPASYLDGCEQVDFEEYQRLGISPYIGSLASDDDDILPSWKDVYKKAVADLEKQAGEIAAYKEGAKALHRGIDDGVAEIKRLTERAAIAEAWAKEQHGLADKYAAELADLRPDALAMRRKRQMDRDRRKGNG